METSGSGKIKIEIIYEGDHCIPCVYMAKVVEAVAKKWGEGLQITKVVLKEKNGARRFYELSSSIERAAPIPSIFVNGQLAFEHTPSEEELETYLKNIIEDQSQDQ